MQRAVSLLSLFGFCLCAVSSSGQPWAVLSVAQAGPVGNYLKTAATPSGNVYQSWFATPTFPLTATYGDLSQASTFVTQITASGIPHYAVRIGGAYRIDALAVDVAGNAYFAGAAPETGLPVTPGAWHSTAAGDFTDYVCELNSAGAIVFCTYLNTNQFVIVAMTVDGAGNIYLTGTNLGLPAPTTPGAFASGGVTIVMKLAPSASNLVFTAALDTGTIASIAVDASQNIFVLSSGPAPNDAAVYGSVLWVLKSDGSALLASTLLRQKEQPIAMALDNAVNLYLVGTEPDGSMSVRKYSALGSTISYEQTVPVWPGPSPAGPFVRPVAIAVDDAGNASVAGYTSALNFPTLHAVVSCNSAAAGNSEEGFLMRLSPSGDLLQSTWLPEGGEPLAISATSSAVYIPAGALTSDGARLIVMTLGPQTGVVDVPFACIGNGASFQLGAISAGEIISLFGSGIGPQQGTSWQLDSNQRLTSTLAGVQVTFDGQPAPLLYVQNSQLNAIVPWQLAGRASSQVCITGPSLKANCIAAAIAPASPGVFSVGMGAAAAVNQDGTLNSPQSPALSGSIVSIYVTGLGPVLPTPVDGSATQLPLPTLVYTVQVLTTTAKPPDTPALVTYAGPAPFEPAGLSQINFQLPNGTGAYEGYVRVALPGGTARLSQYFTIFRK